MKKKIFICYFLGAVGLLLGMMPGKAGTIKGKVVFDGKLPAPEEFEVKSDSTVCGTHQVVPKVIVGDSSGIHFAVVRLIDPKKQLHPSKAAEGLLNQVQCQFEPHVQIVPVGSKLVITSSDTVLHNAHGFSEDGQTVFNIAVPMKGIRIPIELKKPGRIKLRCDAGHAWMRGYIIVAEHAFYVVTDATGAFELKDVPAGTYNLEVWQETLGTQEQKVDVTADGMSEVQFKFSAASLASPKVAR